MRFAIVQPASNLITGIDADDLNAAVIWAGLSPGAIDHGTLRPGLGYVVYEHAMFEPADRQRYFAFGSTLIAGNAVVYGFDSEGATIDLVGTLRVRWFDTVDEIERNIVAGEIKRPVMSLPGEPAFWQWPQPKPDMQEWSRRLGALLADGHPILIDDTIITPIDDKGASS